MEIPDPVPEMTISIPKSGKVRLTSLEMADAWIAAIYTAKDGMVAAQHAMGQCGTDDEDEPKLASDGRPGLPCARFAGHRPPHRDLPGFTWGDVEPHHATETDALCPAYTDENGERWLCSAQAGHGGPDHIAYGPGGEVCHRWPVDGDARDATCTRNDRHGPHGRCLGHLGSMHDAAAGAAPFAIPANRIGAHGEAEAKP